MRVTVLFLDIIFYILYSNKGRHAIRYGYLVYTRNLSTGVFRMIRKMTQQALKDLSGPNHMWLPIPGTQDIGVLVDGNPQGIIRFEKSTRLVASNPEAMKHLGKVMVKIQKARVVQGGKTLQYVSIRTGRTMKGRASEIEKIYTTPVSALILRGIFPITGDVDDEEARDSLLLWDALKRA